MRLSVGPLPIAVNGTKVLLATQRRQRWCSVEAWREFVEFLAIGYGKGYQYAHDLDSKVADMQCLPDNLRDRKYFHPTLEGFERELRKRMDEIARSREESGKHESAKD